MSDSSLSAAAKAHRRKKKPKKTDMDLLIESIEAEEAFDSDDAREEETGRNPHTIDWLYTDEGNGLSASEVRRRRKKFGLNRLWGKKERRLSMRSVLRPLHVMMLITAVLAGGLEKWIEFGILCGLLALSVGISISQQYFASTIRKALERIIEPKVHCLRDGKMQPVQAQELVPGDIIHLRQGDAVPADCRVSSADAPLKVDERIVTGSSQSTAKRYQDTIFYPSAILSGEAFAIVTATGSQTQFSRKASSGASTTDDFGQGSYVAHLCDRVMTAVTATAIAITFVVYVASFYRSSPITTILQFTLGIAIAGIPMGLRATLETIVAVGAAQLARHDAILQNPEVLLDLATFDILLFDELSLLRKAPKVSRPFRMEGVFLPDILLAATLASVSKPELSREDRAIIREARRDARVRRKMSDFKPLLTSKYAPRSLLSYDIAVFRRLKDGAVCQYIKGPPLAILQALEDDDLYSSTSTLFDYLPKAYKLKAEEISNNGNIAIGVAQKLSNSPWHILGLLSITPRLRDDSLYAVRKAWSLGLNIKMLSHHSVPFACTTARSLGLNAKIFDPQKLGVGPESQGDHGMTGSEISSFVDVAGGFAEAEPIHRSYLLQMLDRRGHIIAYAGKDSNEVNVLHDAHVRISAHGASDIIRAAADLVMVAPGLLATVNAIGDCQQILRRMEAYVLYRLAFSLFLQLFLGLWVATLGQILNLELLVFVAVFAEVSAIPTAYDRSPGSFKRESGSARGTFRTALILALILIGGSLIAFSSMARYHDMRQTGRAVAQSDGIVEGFGVPDSVVFLELCLTGTWLNVVTRSDGALWKNLPPWRFSATILTTNIIASLFCVFGWFVEARTSITTVVRVWVFSLGVTLAVSLVFFLERRGLGNIFRSFEQLRRTHGSQEFATERKQRHGQRHKQRSLEDFVVSLQRVSTQHEKSA